MASQSYQLVMRSGPTPGKVFELSKNENYIGRDISNDIVINDSEVSRKHARLVLQAGSFVLEDIGSTNGTFVNGQRLMGPHVLKPGELIMLGENVGLAFEAGYDENATMVASPGPAASYSPPPPSPRETYVPPVRQEVSPAPPPTPASQPMYSGAPRAGRDVLRTGSRGEKKQPHLAVCGLRSSGSPAVRDRSRGVCFRLPEPVLHASVQRFV